jgi:hypothetical protein
MCTGEYCGESREKLDKRNDFMCVLISGIIAIMKFGIRLRFRC